MQMCSAALAMIMSRNMDVPAGFVEPARDPRRGVVAHAEGFKPLLALGDGEDCQKIANEYSTF